LTLLEPDRDKTTVDATYNGSIAERQSEPGRGQVFRLSKDIFDDIGLYDLVEFTGPDYVTKLGVTELTSIGLLVVLGERPQSRELLIR